MTWFDLALVLLLATLIALGVERRLSGLVVGLGGALLLRPLLALAGISPLAAIAAALAAGLGLALLGRRLFAVRRGSPVTSAVLGGVGGAILGSAMLLSLVTSLPIERNFSDQIVYPPRDLPPAFATAVQGSRLVSLGRAILLHPLLDAQGDVRPAERPVLRALHAYLVVGEPWERR